MGGHQCRLHGYTKGGEGNLICNFGGTILENIPKYIIHQSSYAISLQLVTEICFYQDKPTKETAVATANQSSIDNTASSSLNEDVELQKAIALSLIES